jgi:hypothetical protein
MRGRAVEQRRGPLLIAVAVVGCNALSGINDFSAADPPGGSSGTGGASASGGMGASGGDAGTAGSGGTTGAQGSSGDAGDAGTAGVDGAAGDAAADAVSGERCSGAVDEDADGRIDCFDSDCRDDPACAGLCSDAQTLPCNVVRRAESSTATGATARIAPPLYGCGGGKDEPGPEYAYRINVPEGQRVFVELFGLDTDLSAYAVDVPSSAQCDARGAACVAAGASVNGTLPEALTFSSAAGRDYYVVVDGAAAGAYAISVQCSSLALPDGSTSSDGCIPARAIQVGQTLTGSLMVGSAPNVTQKLGAYSCAGGNRSFPEAAFMFTPVEDGSYRIDLTGFSTNADLFVLAAPRCNGVCLSPDSKSVNPAGQNESVTLAATAGTTYYIVVDAYGSSEFTLGVTRL